MKFCNGEILLVVGILESARNGVLSFSIPLALQRPSTLKLKAGVTELYLESLSAPARSTTFEGLTSEYLNSLSHLGQDQSSHILANVDVESQIYGHEAIQCAVSARPENGMDFCGLASQQIDIDQPSGFFEASDSVREATSSFVAELNNLGDTMVSAVADCSLNPVETSTTLLSDDLQVGIAVDNFADKSSNGYDAISDDAATTASSLWDFDITDKNGVSVDPSAIKSLGNEDGFVLNVFGSISSRISEIAVNSVEAVQNAKESLGDGAAAASAAGKDAVSSLHTDNFAKIPNQMGAVLNKQMSAIFDPITEKSIFAASGVSDTVNGITSKKTSVLVGEFGAFMTNLGKLFLEMFNRFLEALTGQSLSELSSSASASIGGLVSHSIETAVHTFQYTLTSIGELTLAQIASAMVSLCASFASMLLVVSDALVKSVSGQSLADWAAAAAGSAENVASGVSGSIQATGTAIGESSLSELAAQLILFLQQASNLLLENISSLGVSIGESSLITAVGDGTLPATLLSNSGEASALEAVSSAFDVLASGNL